MRSHVSPGKESNSESSGRSGSNSDDYDAVDGTFGGEVVSSSGFDDDKDKNDNDSVSVIIVSDALLPISTQVNTHFI